MKIPHRIGAYAWWTVRFIAAIYTALLLTGCTHAPYWTLGMMGVKHAPPMVVITHSIPCQANWIGCYDPNYNVVYIRAGLSPALEACVLSHELKHAKGWAHPVGPQLTYDCGDGSWITALEDMKWN